MTTSEEFLEHYGVKGQRWGVRKKRSAAEVSTRQSRKELVEGRRNISDGDLKTYIERLNNEKKLKSLVEEDISPGKSAVKKIMTDSGQKVARSVIAGVGLYAVKVALTKQFDAKEAAGYLVPKPKNK